MKKILRSFSLLSLLLLWGCQKTEPSKTPSPQQETSKENSLFSTSENLAHYEHKMKQPKLEEMSNYQAILEGYNEKWTSEYTLTDDDVNQLKDDIEGMEEMEEMGSCNPKIIGLHQEYNNMEEIPLKKSDIKEGKTFTTQGKYMVESLWHFPDSVKKQLKEKGWMILDPKTVDKINQKYPDIKKDFTRTDYNQIETYEDEEWASFVQKIWGEKDEELRYPFNTLLVTNDLLLHIFHKVFANELQYYEETQARKAIKEFAENSYQLFLAKYQTEKNPELKDIYAFLTTYRAMPKTLLIDKMDINQKLKEKEALRDKTPRAEREEYPERLSNTEIYQIITDNANIIKKEIPEKYQKVFVETLQKILDADIKNLATLEEDFFLSSYSPDFIRVNEIKQDYSMFRPRSHYEKTPTLKTYFMAMKWLMREKFYFGDDKLSKAALIMTQEIPKEEFKKLEELQEKIKNLIGDDDDVSITKMQDFIKEQGYTSSQEILKNFGEEQRELLAKLQPQKIQSSLYVADFWSSTKEEGKSITEGFIFFGEKFTLDSFIFDLMTAGTAENDGITKPWAHTALMIPDILENNTTANTLVKKWLNKYEGKMVSEGECTLGICTHISSYEQNKQEARVKVQEILNENPLMETMYHQWLELLGKLFNPIQNLPYFKADPNYLFKNILSYMGSYTELKHDTLLYTKQAYAEMGGWGGDMCTIFAKAPALPVPKGYVEADSNFINALLQLNEKTMEHFEDKDRFVAFGEWLKIMERIASQQMKNEKSSDEDFESLRLSYDTLSNIVQPRDYESATSKDERSAIIADIFTAEGPNPLYEAIGRPHIMMLMVKDINGGRIVFWPVYTHYEFFQRENVLKGDQRYNDIEWQEAYDKIPEEKKNQAFWLEMQELLSISKS